MPALCHGLAMCPGQSILLSGLSFLHLETDQVLTSLPALLVCESKLYIGKLDRVVLAYDHSTREANAGRPGVQIQPLKQNG